MDRGCITYRGGREGHDGSDGSDGEVLGTCLSCRQSWVKDVSHVAMAAIVAMEMTMRCGCCILSGRQHSVCDVLEYLLEMYVQVTVISQKVR